MPSSANRHSTALAHACAWQEAFRELHLGISSLSTLLLRRTACQLPHATCHLPLRILATLAILATLVLCAVPLVSCTLRLAIKSLMNAGLR